METVKEIFQSLYDNYRDRIKSPLIGSFIITYLIFNWRLVAILLYSEWPIHCRIEWIEENYCEWYHYVVPFLIALFYVMGLPYLNLGFEKILEKYSNTKLTKKNKSKLDALDQKEKEAKKKRLIADAEAGTSEISNLNLTIKNLTDEINTISERHQKEVERLKNSEKKSNEIVQEIQSEIAEANRDKQVLSKMIDDIRAETEKRFVPISIKKIIDKLSIYEQGYFVQLCDFKIFNNRNSLTHDIDAYNKFVKLELFTDIAPNADVNIDPRKLSEKGEYIYHILKNTL